MGKEDLTWLHDTHELSLFDGSSLGQTTWRLGWGIHCYQERCNLDGALKRLPCPPTLEGYASHIRITPGSCPPTDIVGVYMPHQDARGIRTRMYDYTAALSSACQKEGRILLVGADWIATLCRSDRQSNITTPTLHTEATGEIGVGPLDACLGKEKTHSMTTGTISQLIRHLIGHRSLHKYYIREQHATTPHCCIPYRMVTHASVTVTGGGTPPHRDDFKCAGFGTKDLRIPKAHYGLVYTQG